MAERQYVVFALGGGQYGLDILSIQEITRCEAMAQVPQRREYLEGVINLRGNIIPIVNLRKRFGVAAKAAGRDNRIIIVSLPDKKVGLLVDSVTRVASISDDDVVDAGAPPAGGGRDCVAGIAKKEGEIIILVDPGALLSEEE